MEHACAAEAVAASDAGLAGIGPPHAGEDRVAGLEAGNPRGLPHFREHGGFLESGVAVKHAAHAQVEGGLAGRQLEVRPRRGGGQADLAVAPEGESGDPKESDGPERLRSPPGGQPRQACGARRGGGKQEAVRAREVVGEGEAPHHPGKRVKQRGARRMLLEAGHGAEASRKRIALARLRAADDRFDGMAEARRQSGIFEDFEADGGVGGGTSGRPLALRMRPRRLEEIMGQEHIAGADCLLPRLVRDDNFGSLLFYGPPGSGKTSFAEVIAAETGGRFVRLNAVLSNTAEVRDVLRLARHETERRTILFIDEIHRFNKAQQDLLLPDVEAGHIRLIGATTHNPGFYVNAPLLSRSHLFRLEPLGREAVLDILRRALEDAERGLGGQRCTVEPAALEAVAGFADGDLRRALNALETIVLSQPVGSHIGLDAVERFAGERHIRYDRDEDEHYDHASALIKSIRGSDPDAALYWCFKMLGGGEEPRFLARRLVILASEDIGLANSHALTVANAAFTACETVGMPECEHNLAHAVLYLATSPKSNSVTRAMAAVKKSLREQTPRRVPPELRDAHTKTNRALGHGDGYRYSHDYPEGISGQDYMPDPERFYEPGGAGAEAAIAERLERWRRLKAERRRGEALRGGGNGEMED